jgi:drug efflux transport system permease protein
VKDLKFILQKEFLQISRNKAMLPIMFVIPIVQLVILTYAADFELHNISYAFVDQDKSKESKALLQKFESSEYFNLINEYRDFGTGMESLDLGQTTLLLRIPNGFSEDLAREKQASIMMDVNSIDGQAATLSYSYAVQIVNQYNSEIIQEWNSLAKTSNTPVESSTRFWFNEEMEYKNLMVPGILALLVTMVAMFLSSMNIVREKEIGTIEQVNVTPISRSNFLLGKLLPFWIIAMFELAFGLFIGWLIFNIPMEGSLVLLFAYTGIYLLVVLGMGLWISTFTNTQQQAMFMAWFFMIIFLLMSGLFTPIENMPAWAQNLTLLNPVAYYIKVVRSILLKGSEFKHLIFEFGTTSVYAIAILSIALLNFKKRA